MDDKIRFTNPSRGYPYQNPNIVSTFTNGSSITQDVSAVDILAGLASFMVNDFAVKTIGLKGWSGILGAGVVPFITGALAGMFMGGNLSSPVFFGGELHAAAKLADRLSGGRFGLSETDSFHGPDRLMLSGAHANQLVDHNLVRIPLNANPMQRRTVVR